MHQVDRSKIQEILHEYKKTCFLFEHEAEGHPEHAEVAKETERQVQEILNQNFHFELRKPIDSASAETLGMIENYAREAVLPPVLTRLVEKVIVLERRQAAGVRCLEQLIALLEAEISHA